MRRKDKDNIMCLNSFFAIGWVLIVRSALSEKIFPEPSLPTYVRHGVPKELE